MDLHSQGPGKTRDQARRKAPRTGSFCRCAETIIPNGNTYNNLVGGLLGYEPRISLTA